MTGHTMTDGPVSSLTVKQHTAINTS